MIPFNHVNLQIEPLTSTLMDLPNWNHYDHQNIQAPREYERLCRYRQVDAFRLQVRPQLLLLPQTMTLHLIHSRSHFAVRQQLFCLLHSEVADSDGLHFSVLVQFLHGCPCLLDVQRSEILWRRPFCIFLQCHWPVHLITDNNKCFSILKGGFKQNRKPLICLV